MEIIWNFVLAHRLAVGLGAFWVASNMVSALPSPSNTSGNFYKWLFAFGHGMIGALPRVIPSLRVFDPTSTSATYFHKTDSGTTPPAGG